jgi:hypothetical protein
LAAGGDLLVAVAAAAAAADGLAGGPVLRQLEDVDAQLGRLSGNGVFAVGDGLDIAAAKDA